MANECICKKSKARTYIDVTCTKCAGKIGRIRLPKPFITIAVVSSLSAAGGIWAENAILQNRLPMEEEFALVSSCIEGDSLASEFTTSQLRQIEKDVFDMCVCTISEALNTSPDVSDISFHNAFRDSFEDCREDDGYF